MLSFRKANVYWWRKPLVLTGNRALTAELAVLASELGEGEQGVWLNSRGRTSGAIDLVPRSTRLGASFETRRVPLPPFVTSVLERLYAQAQVAKGCPDLVIWRAVPQSIRLVEVKCPHWDATSAEQERFLSAAAALDIPAKVVEWEFCDDVS